MSNVSDPDDQKKGESLPDAAREEARVGLSNKGLKIAKVEPFCLYYPDNPFVWIFVRMETEEGIVGFGEADGTLVAPIVAALQVLGEVLIGESAWNIEGFWAQHRDEYTHGSTVQAALSAIDIALWDVVGKKLNVPVYTLLGGKVNERVRVYHHPWGRDVESYEDATRQLVSEGITAGKLDPFRSKGYSRELTSEELGDAAGIIRAIREGGGPHFTICVEMHGRFNVATAIRVADAMKPFNPLFIEEPVPGENIAAMREVQRATTLAVATGERIRNTAEYVPLLEQHACRILQPDIGHMGGITSMKRLCHMADNYYVTIAPHCCWGPVQSIASAHVSASSPNFLIQETIGWLKEIFPETLVGAYQYDPQYIDIPEAPGLGIHLSKDFIECYKVDPMQWDVKRLRRLRAQAGAKGTS